LPRILDSLTPGHSVTIFRGKKPMAHLTLIEARGEDPWQEIERQGLLQRPQSAKKAPLPQPIRLSPSQAPISDAVEQDREDRF
jgi:hypothetical protein